MCFKKEKLSVQDALNNLCELKISYPNIKKNIEFLSKNIDNCLLNDIYYLSEYQKRNLRINILCYKDFKKIFNEFDWEFIVLAVFLAFFALDLILQNLTGEYIIINFINSLIENIIKDEFILKVIKFMFSGTIFISTIGKLYNAAVKEGEFLIDKFIFYIEEYLDK